MSSLNPADLLSQLGTDPYPAYAWLRSQPGPFFYESEQTWLVSRYEHVAFVLRDSRFSKQLPADDRSPLASTMLFQDPPNHRRLRETVASAFTPQRIANLTATITRVADRLIDNFEDRKEIDFIRDFANPLPVALIADMLGVSSESTHLIHAWTDSIVKAGVPSVTDINVLQAGGEAIAAMAGFFSDLVADQRSFPSDTLLADLLKSDIDPSYGRLTDQEIVGTCMLLMIAGHETTVNLLGNGLYLLLTHPEQMSLIKQNPSLINTAIEEILRFESPVQRGTYRCAKETVELGGSLITAGTVVGALIGSANRDENIFQNASKFDIKRDPNPHLGFGQGTHFCLGSSLAREEAAIAFNRLFKRLPNIQLQLSSQRRPSLPRRILARIKHAYTQPKVNKQNSIWISNTIVRGLNSLPVTC